MCVKMFGLRREKEEEIEDEMIEEEKKSVVRVMGNEGNVCVRVDEGSVCVCV